VEKWKTKSRFPTFPPPPRDYDYDLFIFKSKTQGGLFQQHSAPSNDAQSQAHRPLETQVHLRLIAIGNKSRFQAHLSIGKCSVAQPWVRDVEVEVDPVSFFVA